MKKRLNETVIANELKGGSLFFAKRTPNEPSATTSDANARTTERVNDRTDGEANGRTPEQATARPDERPNERTPEPVNTRSGEQPNMRTGERANIKPQNAVIPNRGITRHSFQFYQDQIIRLKQLRMQKELQGETCHLSDLVRQAIDDFLAKESEHPNG
ncbi:MAG: hypothetical protein H6657_14515 [Ardenticatenaceae bacterium]|nr:hypothetical protein [Ardenticatenaceae bacterium]